MIKPPKKKEQRLERKKMQWWSIFLLLLGVTIVLMAIFLTDKTRSVLEKRVQLFVANFFAQPGVPVENVTLRTPSVALETKEPSPLASAQGISGVVFVTADAYEVGERKFISVTHRSAWEHGFRWMASENGIPFLTESDVEKLARYPEHHLIISVTRPLFIPDHPYVLCGPLIDQLQMTNFTQGRVVLNTVTSARRQAWESRFIQPEFRFEKIPLPIQVDLYPQSSRQRVMILLSPNPDEEMVQQLQKHCEQQGWIISHFATQEFRHAEYKSLLPQASAVVQWISASDETLPLMEAWACNVPTLVIANSQEFTTFLPLWSETCGAGVNSPSTSEQLLTHFEEFRAELNTKAPRQYLNDMSAEQWLQRYRLIFQ